jgi:hypothetical protein
MKLSSTVFLLILCLRVASELPVIDPTFRRKAVNVVRIGNAIHPYELMKKAKTYV